MNEVNDINENYNTGWVRLYRSISDKGWYKKSEYTHLWLHLLIKATHKGFEIMFSGENIKLEPGQFLTGRKALSRETGINESKIERILNFFEKNEQQIEQQKCNKNRVISILNWNQYQQTEQQTEQQLNNKRTTTEQQLNTYNNVNNINNVNNTQILTEKEKDLCVDVLKYFGYNEMNHPNKLFDLSKIIQELILNDQYDKFVTQFSNYKKLKDSTGQIKHTLSAFMVEWDKEDWGVVLKNNSKNKPSIAGVKL